MTTKWAKIWDAADMRIKNEKDVLKDHKSFEELKANNIEISIESYHEL